VNGDGLSDLLIGTPSQNVGGNLYQGQAFVFSGSDGSLLYILDDPIPQIDAWFGWAVAGAEDVNGDTVPDILVGAIGQNAGGNFFQGQVFVFSGSDGSLLHTLDDPNPQENATFGFAVAGAGDVNSDGLADLLIGAPGQNVGGNGAQGQAFVFVSLRVYSIDIQPGSDPNIINLGHTQRIRVVLFSADGFNAPVAVDEASLTFGRTGDEDSLLREHGVPDCRTQDVNADGLPDLVCTFKTQRAGFVCGDTVGILKGTTLDGILITGQDLVVIEPCRP
jgi:hypothetical protein